MEGSDLNYQNDNGTGVTLRDLMAVAFRHRRLISITFLGILSGAILIAVLQPNRYEAAMKILVKKDRVDAVVTSDANESAPQNGLVTEEELNSEVVLLKSTDLLERIVLVCNLQPRPKHGGLGMLASILPTGLVEEKRRSSVISSANGLPMADMSFFNLPLLHDAGIHMESAVRTPITSERVVDASSLQPKRWPQVTASEQEPVRWDFSPFEYQPIVNLRESGSVRPEWVAMSPTLGNHPLTWTSEENIGIAKAVRQLDKDLRVDAIKKTNVIVAAYNSRDPQLAAQVLATLANLYLEKHVAVHRPTGAFDFFQREAQKYREELSKAENDLMNFDRDAQVVSAQLEKEATLQKLADFKVVSSQTEAAIAETQQRIQVLQTTSATLPTRMVTQIRNADDGMLISALRSNLVTLEQKRIELLGKFEPSYRAVQEVDAQIAAARAALAEKSQLHDETTDRDPTYQWTQEELAKAKADLAGLQARAGATAQAVQAYEGNARSLASKELAQDDLLRSIKSAEENYLLSLRKEEEARMSDALDQGRILNVAIAEPASVPALPSNHRLRTVFFGFLLALFASGALAFASERADSTVRTPEELGSILNVPVLAAIPKNGKNITATFA